MNDDKANADGMGFVLAVAVLLFVVALGLPSIYRAAQLLWWYVWAWGP